MVVDANHERAQYTYCFKDIVYLCLYSKKRVTQQGKPQKVDNNKKNQRSTTRVVRGDGNEAPKAYALRRMSEGGRAEAVKDVSGCVENLK